MKGRERDGSRSSKLRAASPARHGKTRQRSLATLAAGKERKREAAGEKEEKASSQVQERQRGAEILVSAVDSPWRFNSFDVHKFAAPSSSSASSLPFFFSSFFLTILFSIGSEPIVLAFLINNERSYYLAFSIVQIIVAFWRKYFLDSR